MDLIEITEKADMKREAAAELLRKVADQLERHNEVALHRNGITLHAKVADVVSVEIELEVESDESKLEIEIEW